MEFFADDGTPLSLPIGGVARTSLAVSLGAKSVAHIVTDGTSPTIKVGWARVTQTAVAAWFAIGGSAIFQTVNNGRIAAEAGVSSSPLASHFMTPVNSLGSTQSGLAICNPNNANVSVTFRLRDPSGQIVDSTVRTLAAFEHMAQFFTELFPAGFNQFEGTVEVVSVGGAVSGVALRYDNSGGTVFATTPVIVMP